MSLNGEIRAWLAQGEALAFLRRGLLSTTPRQIDDADALPVLYWIARGSQRYVREGRALMDALKAWHAGY